MTAIETAQRAGLRAHQWLYERTDGRVGHRIGPLSTLLLRTRGRRSGRTRTSALVYVEDGPGRFVVVGSNGGDDRAPGWWHNLQADAHAEVQIGRRRFPVVAHDAAGDERARLWQAVNRVNRYRGGGRYDYYQSRTERPIPVVVLSATTGDPPAAGPGTEG